MTESLLTKEETDAIRVFRAALEDECFQDAILLNVAGRHNNSYSIRANKKAHRTAIRKILESDDEHLADIAPAICYIYYSASNCGYVTDLNIIPQRGSLFTGAATKYWASLREKTLNDDVRDML